MSPPPLDQQSIRDAIAREESRLLRLEEELTEAQTRLAALKTTRAFGAARTSIPGSGRTPGRDVKGTRRPVGTSGSGASARSPE
jgi:hypothetical protein